ncbi:HAD-IA family hydrolase [Planctomicrobium sp. SH668]|uniref:HAD-IA family hydrolase n=1 Tax=Planctomicrobium sp. SH668 TaxID=3448126 RepID=UPI003F5B067D
MTESCNETRCVVFDAVGTLIHPSPSVAEIYYAIGKKFGLRYSLKELAPRFKSAMKRRPATEQTDEESEFNFWKALVDDVLGPVDSPEQCFLEIYNHFAQSDAWRVGTDVAETLQVLKDHGIVTVIASNFDERLDRLVQQIPTLQLVDHLIISSRVGWRKPHLNFFNQVLKIVQLPARNVLMVGDDYELDVIGAQSAGMQAMHLSDIPAPGGTHGFFRGTSVSDVLPIVNCR